MKKSTIWIIVVVVIIIGGLYWYMTMGGSTVIVTPPGTTNTSVDTSADDVTASTTLVLNIGTNDTLGSYLTAATNGMTLYTYQNDSLGSASSCTGDCATTWPPY